MVEALTDVEHNYSLRIPTTTPTRQGVAILKDEREGVHRVHEELNGVLVIVQSCSREVRAEDCETGSATAK